MSSSCAILWSPGVNQSYKAGGILDTKASRSSSWLCCQTTRKPPVPALGDSKAASEATQNRGCDKVKTGTARSGRCEMIDRRIYIYILIVVVAKQLSWMWSLCNSVVEDLYLQWLEIVSPTWLRISWTYIGLTVSLLSPTWSCLLDLRRWLVSPTCWTYVGLSQDTNTSKSNMLDSRWT